MCALSRHQLWVGVVVVNLLVLEYVLGILLQVVLRHMDSFAWQSLRAVWAITGRTFFSEKFVLRGQLLDALRACTCTLDSAL